MRPSVGFSSWSTSWRHGGRAGGQVSTARRSPRSHARRSPPEESARSTPRSRTAVLRPSAAADQTRQARHEWGGQRQISGVPADLTSRDEAAPILPPVGLGGSVRSDRGGSRWGVRSRAAAAKAERPPSGGDRDIRAEAGRGSGSAGRVAAAGPAGLHRRADPGAGGGRRDGATPVGHRQPVAERLVRHSARPGSADPPSGARADRTAGTDKDAGAVRPGRDERDDHRRRALRPRYTSTRPRCGAPCPGHPDAPGPRSTCNSRRSRPPNSSSTSMTAWRGRTAM
jgi:hypothetical protein